MPAVGKVGRLPNRSRKDVAVINDIAEESFTVADVRADVLKLIAELERDGEIDVAAQARADLAVVDRWWASRTTADARPAPAV